MKIILLFIIFVISSFKYSSSENLRIKVIDDKSNPVPYAHILKNNLGVTITDINGMCSISKKTLYLLDTIKVSFIGMESQYVIYNEDLMKCNEHVFYLKDEKVYHIDEVVISAANAIKLFKKYSNIGNRLFYNCVLDFDFTINIEEDGKASFENGQLKVYNEVHSKELENFSSKGWFHHFPETNLQKEKINNYLHEILYYSMTSLYIAIWGIRQNHLRDLKPYYYYLGIEGDLRIFRISFPTSYQILVFLDIKTGELLRINCELIHPENFSSLKLESDLKKFKTKRPKMPAVLIPETLESQLIYNNKKLELHLSNLSIKRVKNIKTEK